MNEPQRVKFTIDAVVVGKREWNEMRETNGQLPDRPRVNINYGGIYGVPGFYRRVGQMMGVGDKWWAIEFGLRARSVGNDVVEAIRDHLLPAMLREMDAPRDRNDPSQGPARR